MATKKKAAVKKAAVKKSPGTPSNSKKKDPPAGQDPQDSGATIHGIDGVIPCAECE